MKIGDYKHNGAVVMYNDSCMEAINREIKHKGESICYLCDTEMAYLIRAGYTVRCTEKQTVAFIEPYPECIVTKGGK